MSWLVVIDHEAVVVALAVVQGREVSLYLSTDFLELLEVHRSSGHRISLADRNQSLVGRQIDSRIEPQFVVKNIPVPLAIQIEIGMVGKVQHSRLVGLRRECQLQRIVLAPLVVGDNLQIAGITCLSVL